MNNKLTTINQQALIETNLQIIGFNAWNGYLKTGRGVVVCTTNSPLLDRFGETFKLPNSMSWVSWQLSSSTLKTQS